MRWLLVVLAAFALLALGTGVGSASPPGYDTEGPSNNSSVVSPGEQFAGVIGVQGAEVRGEIAGRTFDERVENADGPDERASVVGEQLRSLRDRIDDLRTEYGDRETATRNGSADAGERTTRDAVTAAESAAADELLDRTARAADSLPPGAEVDEEAIGAVRNESAALDRNESGAIAVIGGADAGRRLRGPPEWVQNRTGPPAVGGNETDVGATRNGSQYAIVDTENGSVVSPIAPNGTPVEDGNRTAVGPANVSSDGEGVAHNRSENATAVTGFGAPVWATGDDGNATDDATTETATDDATTETATNDPTAETATNDPTTTTDDATAEDGEAVAGGGSSDGEDDESTGSLFGDGDDADDE
ncbi:hypothetical protein BRD17_07140 [Halobacteriales archaeon SW_7_68_16]|nr:MAG: hypothetical protein BRD17_07140 [Halobacteriales archaeon SW_7_68_16]